MKKKFIELDEVQKITLQEGHKNSESENFSRTLSLFGFEFSRLSSQGVSRDFSGFRDLHLQLVQALGKRRFGWIKGQSRARQKGILQDADLAVIKERVQENAQRLKIVREKLKVELGKRVFN